MLKPTRQVTHIVARTLAVSALAAAPSLLTNACSNEAAQRAVRVGEAGRLQLNLTGTSNTNRVYQLENARFVITGLATGVNAEVNTETQPNTSSLLVELPPDNYEVLLAPGYHLELLPGRPARDSRLTARDPGASAPGGSGKVAARPVSALYVDAGPPPTTEPPLPPPDGSVVDATLVSSNPALVNIQPRVVSSLDFTFQVAGGSVETGTGVLDIGITVIDDDLVCAPDSFEPNDDTATATPITTDQPTLASSCSFDVDNFIFPAPVPTGDLFVATVSFRTASGDIDAVLLEASTGNRVAFGSGVEDTETLVATSNGGDYILQTFLFSDPDGGGNTYSVSVAGFVNDAQNTCCSTSEAPGCSDNSVRACVCAADPSCCAAAFDPACVSLAIAECGADCEVPAPVSDCCSASSTPGCTLPEVAACVCAIDPFCCAASFDDNCAALADSRCGAECPL